MICSNCKIRWAPLCEGYPDVMPTDEEEIERTEIFFNDEIVYCGCMELTNETSKKD